MKHLFKVALFSCLIMGVLSCKKDTESVPRKQTIIAKSWNMTSFKLVNASGAEVEMISTFFEACRRDNLLKFAADGTYKEDEGASKCDPADPQTFDSGTWTISADETKMTLTPAGETTSDLSFVSFSTSEVKLKGVDPVFGAIVVTYKAQ